MNKLLGSDQLFQNSSQANPSWEAAGSLEGKSDASQQEEEKRITHMTSVWQHLHRQAKSHMPHVN